MQVSSSCVPVFVEDLAARGPQARRWPVFAAAAVGAGAAAVFSFPVGGPVTALGTLDLYRTVPGGLEARDIRVAMMVADAIAWAITALHRNAPDSGEVVTWLEGAEADHEEVYQATGMIMVQCDVDADEALALLRARAYAQGRTATAVARDIVSRTTDIDDHE
jgi:hypothetical protein